MNQLTMGRRYLLRLSDDGTLMSTNASTNTTQSFMSKTPINKSLAYFEIELLAFKPQYVMVAIGLGEFHFHADKKLGQFPGSIGFNCENGKVHINGLPGIYTTEHQSFKFETGDVIGCGINVETAKFRTDKTLKSHQILDVYFTKNGVKVHQTRFNFLGDTLFPCVSLSHVECKVRLISFYPGCFPPGEKTHDESTQVKKKVEEEKTDNMSEGCQFVVVSVGTGAADEKDKIKQIKSQLDLDKDLTLMSDLKVELQKLERKLASLDFQGQNYYSRLCWNMECLQRICQHKDRIHFMSVNVKSGEGYDQLVEKLIDLHESHWNHYPLQYDVHTFVQKGLDTITAKVTSCSILCKSEEMGKKALGGSHEVYIAAVKLLHAMGRVVYFKYDADIYAIDMGYLEMLFDKILTDKEGKPDQNVTTTGEGTLFWAADAFNKKKNFKNEQVQVVRHLLIQMGVLRLPFPRTRKPDPANAKAKQQSVTQPYYNTPIQHLVNPNVRMSDYWAKGKRPADSVLMWRTYKFKVGMPTGLLTALVTLCSQFSRLQLMMKEGGVFQSGAVQTTIVKHTVEKAVDALTIECKCFVPDSDVGPINDDTRYHVEEYTWNVFCILADVIDSHLDSCGLLPIIQEEVPKWFVNASIGCTHDWGDWGVSDSPLVQSICTLCDLCCDLGSECKYNGIMGQYLRQCECGTKVTGCKSCGICRRCAQHLWALRSSLRPCCETSSLVDDVEAPCHVALDGVAFNEVEFINFNGVNHAICLKKHGDSSEDLIQVLPGAAHMTKWNDIARNKKNVKTHQVLVGDRVKISLHHIQKHESQQQEEGQDEEAILDIHPVYHALTCHGVRVCHDTGVVCYDSSNGKVGQFVSSKPLSLDCNSFSIRILNPGKKCSISIGLVGKYYKKTVMPGMEAVSAAYSAEGLVCVSSPGKKEIKADKALEGQTLSCSFDIEEQVVTFCIDNKQVHKTDQVQVPPGGFLPVVALKTEGEAVKLLDLDPWMLRQGETPTTDSQAFDTYKYGNLWISPGHRLCIQKTQTNMFGGWIILHNPSNDLIGYVITTEPMSMEFINQLEPDKTKPIRISAGASGSFSKVTSMEVIWFTLDSGKKYTATEIKKYLSTLTSESYHGHLLKVKIEESKSSAIVNLTRAAQAKPHKMDMYELHVSINGSLLDRYYLRGGNYSCLLPHVDDSRAPDVMLYHPRRPTFDQPGVLQRGARVIAQPVKDQYMECVIKSLSTDNTKLSLEFSPKDSNCNEELDMTSIKEIQLEKIPLKAVEIPVEDGDDKKEDTTTEDKPKPKVQMKADIDIQGFESRENMVADKRPYMFPPSFLLTKASRQAIDALDPDWKLRSLVSVARCSTRPTRITVQELQITEHARTLADWNVGETSVVEKAYIFLPSGLDFHKLLYSPVLHLFKDLQVHRLCLLRDQVFVRHKVEDRKMSLDIPIHLVNIPPLTPQPSLPTDLMFASHNSGWAYTALIATKLILPVFDKILSGMKPDASRQQVENQLTSLLKVYTAQCHIFAEQRGAMYSQQGSNSHPEDIEKSIPDSDSYRQDFKGELFEDPSLLMVKKKNMFCKGHQLSMKTTEIFDPEEAKQLLYDHKYFEPYNETVNYFHRELPNQKSLPDDFFSRFSNLQYLVLENCHNLQSIPNGVSGCAQLQAIILQNGAMKQIPEDLFLVPRMEQLTLHRLPLTTLPSKWPTTSHLTQLSLTGLMITRIPPEICKFPELTHLDLSSNPLTDVPHDFRKLQKLKYLNLSGMPWLVPTSSQLTSGFKWDGFKDWCSLHSYVHTFLDKQDIKQQFDNYDLNRNGKLDAAELSALNAELFWNIPRLGSQCITDEEFGGIPPAVFQLHTLETLVLNFTAITQVPMHMCRLVKLQNLDLNNNPLMESLPGSLGHMPNLARLNLSRCPSLRTPPNEVVSRGFESVKAYLKRLSGGFTVCRRTKLMLVGLGGAGKTSLLKALMDANKKTKGTSGENVTDGIAIQPWTVTTPEQIEVTYSAWDFAGQTLYYNTHQFFLSKRAVYMLLWSTRQGFEHAGLDFWLSSIACHAPKTPIFIVGTHCDQVPKADIPMAELTKTYPQIAGFHFVSSIEGTGVAELEKQLLKVTLEQKNMGEKIPQVWLKMETMILDARDQNSIMDWSVIKEYGMGVGIYDDKDIKEAIEFLHELGSVQYFDNEFLRHKVVINPQWIVDVMACVVSVKNSPIKDEEGRFHHKHISDVWKEYPPSLHKWLLQLTEEFDLTFPLPKEPVNVVPCLLPPEEPAELNWPLIPRNSDVRQTKMMYKFSYLPAGLFNRVQVRLFQFSDGKFIWKRGSLLKKNNHLALIRQISNFEVIVWVQGQRPENILFLIHEVFESLIEESFHGVVYDFLVPCPDCIMKEGCLEPSLFDSELVYAAKDHKAPFLQCRKYFHTISMSQLMENMPNTHAGDFDAHLQHSLMMLQELNSALTTDVAVLYSASDVPAPRDPAEKINPFWVKEDVQAVGLSVWFCEDMLNASIQDLMLALKNCKVVVALVSDNFEKDEKCRDLMLYTMNTLHKDYVILTIGGGMSWQNTDLGMRIGKQELMVMAKNKSRYRDKVKELQKLVQQKLRGIQTKSKEYPLCFISYCWCNSKDAVSQGTKARPGSMGWGDPRSLKKYLESNGVSTWIDHEQMVTGKGLFENITQGMRYAKVMVACVSDEYAESANCMMELRFGVLNLNLPLILAVVGSGSEWMYMEAGALAQRAKADRVHFQEESSTAYSSLLKLVKQQLPQKAGESSVKKEVMKQEMRDMQKAAISQNNIRFQEEYELTQRRFMRHIITFVSNMDTTPMPRLAVIDFDRKPLSKQTESSESTSSQSSRPKSSRPRTASRIRERIEMVNPDLQNWESDSFCLLLLCEYEEGWHLCDQSFPLTKTEEFVSQIKKVSPYLARIYAILRQSSMQLNCLSGDTGKQFLDWVEQEAQGSDFLEAYEDMRVFINDSMKLRQKEVWQTFISQLCRCHLPSGKVFWLCKKHQSGPRITKLSQDTGSRVNQRKVIFEDAILLKELIEKSEVYQKKKVEKSNIKQLEPTPTPEENTKLQGKQNAKEAKQQDPKAGREDEDKSGQTSQSPEDRTQSDAPTPGAGNPASQKLSSVQSKANLPPAKKQEPPTSTKQEPPTSTKQEPPPSTTQEPPPSTTQQPLPSTTKQAPKQETASKQAAPSKTKDKPSQKSSGKESRNVESKACSLQ
ncbi:uncharacterized protein LOC124124359 [Haliotis rufescens]|uniref:uncharacterized protein LOC124124359 n=1 Tax=Haliotis rufescens TaxID=6454 RepID=UPI00201E8F31|nr:uncharacterized protein LOC124124359 [Haliotis rufescens]